MTLFKNDDTLGIIYKLFQAYSYFFHQNKTEITSTITSETNKVPSCAAVSTALAGKLDTGVIASGINTDNRNDDNSVPSVKAVADYVNNNISGATDFAAVKEDTTLTVSNETDGLCAVRVTKMSDGTTQYQSAMALGTPVNQKTAFTFNIIASENYMVEAWHFNNSTNKLVPAAVKYV